MERRALPAKRRLPVQQGGAWARCASRCCCLTPPGWLAPPRADEEMVGDPEGEHFSVLSLRTMGALLSVLGGHVEGVLGCAVPAPGRPQAAARLGLGFAGGGCLPEGNACITR